MACAKPWALDFFFVFQYYERARDRVLEAKTNYVMISKLF
jgi:hypothetical protein